MATKAQALAVAARLGFVLDETVSGKIGIWFSVTFDHPMSLSGDCRSIHIEDTSASVAWAEAIERMESEAKHLQPCTDKFCDYHHG